MELQCLRLLSVPLPFNHIQAYSALETLFPHLYLFPIRPSITSLQMTAELSKVAVIFFLIGE